MAPKKPKPKPKPKDPIGPIEKENYAFGTVDPGDEFWDDGCTLCNHVVAVGHDYVVILDEMMHLECFRELARLAPPSQWVDDGTVDARVEEIRKTFEKTGKLGDIPLVVTE